MAYITQEKKKEIAAKMKPLLKQYGIKATMSIDNHSVLYLNVKAGKLDFIGNTNTKRAADNLGRYEYEKSVMAEDGYTQPNRHNLEWAYDGECLEFLKKAYALMGEGNWDKSDSQSDYFDVGWYYYIKIGNWNKPYELMKE